MLQLNDQWALKFTETSVDVYEIKINQKTEGKYFLPRFYYANLSQALEGIIDRSLVDELTEFKAVVERINELKADIKAFLQKYSSVRAL